MEKLGPHMAISSLIHILDKSPLTEDHCRNKENQIDPDDGNSWTCDVCSLPIFATPFVNSDNGDGIYLHDRCAKLPTTLEDCNVHPNEPLVLRKKSSTSSAMHSEHCTLCNKSLHTTMFVCAARPRCEIQIDVICALPRMITILHRSHQHRLTVIRSDAALFVCNACGTRHDNQSSSSSSSYEDQLAYMCSPCCYWIHPSCASLPNAILIQHADNHQLHHQHPFILYYGKAASRSMDSPNCGICQRVIESIGMYSCIDCQYYVHIMCAFSHPHHVDTVLIREARFRNLVHLPVGDEHTSLVPHLRKSTIGTSSTNTGDDEDYKPMIVEYIHEHPLVIEHHTNINDDDDDDVDRVCNACCQLISPPFYKCSQCPNFILHNFCALLPPELIRHTDNYERQVFLRFSPKATSESCNHCRQSVNGLSYSYMRNSMHVLCALMPSSITHDAHPNAHILYSIYTGPLHSFYHNIICDCCAKRLSGAGYECRTCHGFRIHALCALLPKSVTHKFDEHPLNLITAKRSSQQLNKVVYCEICEEQILYNKVWYYSCYKCDQSFHPQCIPSVRHIVLSY